MSSPPTCNNATSTCLHRIVAGDRGNQEDSSCFPFKLSCRSASSVSLAYEAVAGGRGLHSPYLEFCCLCHPSLVGGSCSGSRLFLSEVSLQRPSRDPWDPPYCYSTCSGLLLPPLLAHCLACPYFPEPGQPSSPSQSMACPFSKCLLRPFDMTSRDLEVFLQ